MFTLDDVTKDPPSDRPGRSPQPSLGRPPLEWRGAERASGASLTDPQDGELYLKMIVVKTSYRRKL